MWIADELTGQLAARYPEWFASVERPVGPWRWAVLGANGVRQAVRGEITLERICKGLPDLGAICGIPSADVDSNGLSHAPCCKHCMVLNTQVTLCY